MNLSPAVPFHEVDKARPAEGRIPRWAPFVVLVSRSFFILLFQGFTFLLLRLLGDPDPAVSVRHWFSVYGTLADFGCLALLWWLTWREGLRLFDLIGFVRSKLKSDILLGLGILVVLFPLSMFVVGRLALMVTYGTLTPEFAEGTFIRTLPLWAVLYSRVLWWPLWSATEEMVYNGYALPRLVAITKSTWLSVALVSFFYSIQHSFHSIATMEHAVYMFLIFIPLTVGMAIVYLRVRRLTPLIIGHWLMDLMNVLFMLQIA